MGLGIGITYNDVGDELLASADLVEVDQYLHEPSQYRLHYGIDIVDDDIPLAVESKFDPGALISVLVPGDETACLIKGPVYRQQIGLQHGGEGSSLILHGGDSRLLMDREARSVVWSDVTDSDAVTTIVSGYGFTSDVETTGAGHYEDKHTLVQRDTDYVFIKRLARRNGFLFWIDCDESGIETAHFKRPPLDGDAALELIINLVDANIQSLDIEWDVERPTSSEARQVDASGITDISGDVGAPPLAALGTDSLQQITGDIRSLLVSAPTDDAGDLTARAEAAVIEAEWFVSAHCVTSFAKLADRVVFPGQIVNVRGAGSRHSGKYLVDSVKHRIDEVNHRMALNLIRNAWGA
jgi:phage protein D